MFMKQIMKLWDTCCYFPY